MHGEAKKMEEEDIRCIRPSKVSLQNAQIATFTFLHVRKKFCFVFLACFAFESSQ